MKVMKKLRNFVYFVKNDKHDGLNHNFELMIWNHGKNFRFQIFNLKLLSSWKILFLN